MCSSDVDECSKKKETKNLHVIFVNSLECVFRLCSALAENLQGADGCTAYTHARVVLFCVVFSFPLSYASRCNDAEALGCCLCCRTRMSRSSSWQCDRFTEIRRVDSGADDFRIYRLHTLTLWFNCPPINATLSRRSPRSGLLMHRPHRRSGWELVVRSGLKERHGMVSLCVGTNQHNFCAAVQRINFFLFLLLNCIVYHWWRRIKLIKSVIS